MYNNPLPRRVFLRRLARLAGGAATASVLPAARSDERLETGYLEYGGLRCYVARPGNTTGKMPVVLVIHGNRGLDPHIEDVARRAAFAGFAAVAPDLLFPGGGTPRDEGRAREMVADLDRAQTITNLLAIVDDLAARPQTGKLGCIGFHWGGGMASELAVRSPAIVAVAAFYGASDERIDTGVPAFEGALKAAGVRHAIHVYPDPDHAAAELAWTRTITFLKEALR